MQEDGVTVTERPPVEPLDDRSEHKAVLRAVEVVKDYGSGTAVRRALDGVDLDIIEGQFIAVVGPSGSGKSTLLHLFGALDVATGGEIWIEGRRLNDDDEAARTELRRHRVGFVFQQYNLIPVISGRENVALPLVISRVPAVERDRRVDDALRLVGLGAAVAAQRPAELSGGEQQRIAIARALVTEPVVILADEPTGALDTDTSRAVLAVLRRICDDEGRTVVLATHDPAAAAMADEIVQLRDGKIVDRHVVGEVSLPDVFDGSDVGDGP